MEKINFTRVLSGGILASVVFIVAEVIIEGLLKLIIGFNEANMAREYFPNIMLSGARYQIINILYLLVSCTAGIWLYAVLRPKFGEGIKTAFIASLFIIFVIFLYMVNNINMEIFPLKPAVISLALSIAEFPAAIIGGAVIYKAA
jgi:hypothetical protein